MAAKIKLGKLPETIAHTVEFTMPDGTLGAIPVVYRYRTRSGFAQFMDEMSERARAATEQDVDRVKQSVADGEDADSAAADITSAYIYSRGSAAKADFIMECVTDWGLDVPFSREAVMQLIDEQPGGANKIMADYRIACTEGRAGN